MSILSLHNLKRFTKEWSHKSVVGEYNSEEGLSFPVGFVMRLKKIIFSCLNIAEN